MKKEPKITVRFLKNREVWKIGKEAVGEIRDGKNFLGTKFAYAFGRELSNYITAETARRSVLRAIRARRKAWSGLEMPDVFAR